MLRNSGEADRSHGNAAGNKSILEKRRIKEDSNKDDHMKDAHVPKLKKLKKSPSHIYKKSGEIINPHPNGALKRVLGKIITEEDHKGQVGSVHVPKL